MERLVDLGLLVVVGLALLDAFMSPHRRLSARQQVIRHVERARREGTLGPLRTETRDGNLYVVGYGQRVRVQTRADGQRLIARLNRQTERVLKGVLGERGQTQAPA